MIKVTREWAPVGYAATVAGFSEATLRRYIAQGLVYAERVGPKIIRVDLNSVRNLAQPIVGGGDGE